MMSDATHRLVDNLAAHAVRLHHNPIYFFQHALPIKGQAHSTPCAVLVREWRGLPSGTRPSQFR